MAAMVESSWTAACQLPSHGSKLANINYVDGHVEAVNYAQTTWATAGAWGAADLVWRGPTSSTWR